jgi:hypothetical protein
LAETASDWVLISLDAGSVGEKLVVLKTLFPGADVASMVQRRPKMLLQKTAALQEDATKVQ